MRCGSREFARVGPPGRDARFPPPVGHPHGPVVTGCHAARAHRPRLRPRRVRGDRRALHAARCRPDARRLPRIVDESVGMYVVRRALGRPTEAASDRRQGRCRGAAVSPRTRSRTASACPGAPEPTVPTRFVVSQAQPQAHPIPPVVPITTRPVVGGRPQARRRGAALVPLQRRIAALGTLVAILLVGFAALSLPRAPEEAVLSATGTPGATPAIERARVRADAVADRRTARERSRRRRPRLVNDLVADRRAPSATPPPAIATQAVIPTRTPTRRPGRPRVPRLRPTPAPTPPPTPCADPAPTPRPRRPTRPRRRRRRRGHRMFIVGPDGHLQRRRLHRAPVWRSRSCFEQGATVAGNPASHTYADAGQYIVTLTVTDDLGQTSSDTDTITVPSRTDRDSGRDTAADRGHRSSPPLQCEPPGRLPEALAARASWRLARASAILPPPCQVAHDRARTSRCLSRLVL